MRGSQDDSNDLPEPCRVSRYRALLESPPDHSPPDELESSLTLAAATDHLDPEALAGQAATEVLQATGELLPAGLAAVELPIEGLPTILVPGETAGDLGVNGDRSELNSASGDGNNLRVPSVVNDDCSEGSQCSLDDTQLGQFSLFRDLPARGRASDRSSSERDSDSDFPGEDDYDEGIVKGSHADKMRKWSRQASDKYEEMLLECIVNTDSIRPNYQDIFIDYRTIQKLERVTTLSLTRGKAFSHGVLRGNRVTGAVLYGPPGTGKSLLARGMAKQSGFNMIAVSTAELWQKCHGQDEKVIKALFSMARKLYPSIVFIDEADALLGARKAGEKRHIRGMINKFLMEWDGITSGVNSPFVLLATNRPFDLDPAVLRRAPVHIHLDVPNKNERLGILGLLLKEEELAGDITIEKLALLTQKYTGSDLKNLCVTAASECVSEQQEDTADRVLQRRHFMSALNTVKATGLSKTLVNEFQNFEKNARYEEARPEE